DGVVDSGGFAHISQLAQRIGIEPGASGGKFVVAIGMLLVPCRFAGEPDNKIRARGSGLFDGKAGSGFSCLCGGFQRLL
ncbi:MAG: hypothetical protein ACRYGK_13545, partial [Janthinobacterium lividum]